MTPDEYADTWQAALYLAEATRDRNQQTSDRILGVSDIGHCRSYAARFLRGDPFTDAPDQSATRRGHWTHEAVLPIVADATGALHEREVTVTLPSGQEVVGHADLIDPAEPSVTDLKTTDGGNITVRRNGSNPQQKMQRNLYAAGAVQEGLVTADGLLVRNVWMDVADLTAPPYVEQEPYDPSYLEQADAWLGEVRYHVDNDLVDDAPRDKDVFFCRRFCPFATACRGTEATDVDDTIESDELAVAAALHREALDMEKEAKELRRAAGDVLERVDGRVQVVGSDGRRFRVATTMVRESEVSYVRAGYRRTDVKEIN